MRKRELSNLNELAENKLVSREQFAQMSEEYQYMISRRNLVLDIHQQDSLYRLVQINSLEESVKRMGQNLEFIKQKLDNLTIRAQIPGQLTALHADLGQLISSGMRIGQIDELDEFKVRCAIDEHYITRVTIGQKASFTYGSRGYKLRITKVYPEVHDGRFDVDMEFLFNAPEGIRRGQSLRIQLVLDDPTQALLLPRGGFFHSTGGRWIYILNENETVAKKRIIKLGRKNSDVFEVIDGLERGDKVITSSYDNYGNADKLLLRQTD